MVKDHSHVEFPFDIRYAAADLYYRKEISTCYWNIVFAHNVHLYY